MDAHSAETINSHQLIAVAALVARTLAFTDCNDDPKEDLRRLALRAIRAFKGLGLRKDTYPITRLQIAYIASALAHVDNDDNIGWPFVAWASTEVQDSEAQIGDIGSPQYLTVAWHLQTSILNWAHQQGRFAYVRSFNMQWAEALIVVRIAMYTRSTALCLRRTTCCAQS